MERLVVVVVVLLLLLLLLLLLSTCRVRVWDWDLARRSWRKEGEFLHMFSASTMLRLRVEWRYSRSAAWASLRAAFPMNLVPDFGGFFFVLRNLGFCQGLRMRL